MISLCTDQLFLPFKQLLNFRQESSFGFSLHVHPIFPLLSLAVRCHRIAELEEISELIHPINPSL